MTPTEQSQLMRDVTAQSTDGTATVLAENVKVGDVIKYVTRQQILEVRVIRDGSIEITTASAVGYFMPNTPFPIEQK